MKSHTYDLNLPECWAGIQPILVLIGIFAVLMHAGAFFHWWPSPRPALDIDRTILLHQADASRKSQPAQCLLLGDSSCMMDVNADTLGRSLGMTCLNLGTLSFLDLHNHAQLLGRYLENADNQNQLKTVVLLMHPEALRRFGADPVYRRLMEDYFAGRDPELAPGWNARLRALLGLHLFQGRLLARALPSPLRGGFGSEYGFTHDLDRYLTRHRGSAIDPSRQSFTGNPEYALHPNLEARSREFREILPRNIGLAVGITPLPESFAPDGYASDFWEMLREWSTWLEADMVLTNLPPTLADRYFATKTHLNPQGVNLYTRLLAEALGTIAPPPQSEMPNRP